MTRFVIPMLLTCLVSGAILFAQEAVPGVALTDLTPSVSQIGTAHPVEGGGVRDEPDVVKYGSWINNVGYWKDHRKIVAAVPAEFALGEGEVYKSSRPDVFMVAGEPVDGVGLWAKAPSMYHWVEYPIPGGSARFTARVLATDDPLGYTRGYRKAQNQNGYLVVLVDGKEVLRQSFMRLEARDGSGEKLHDLDLPLPADAKAIRFRIEHTPWGDGNNNTELVINKGRFLPAE